MIAPFVAASRGPFFLIVLLGLFLFLFILPNRRRQRAAREQLKAIDVGVEVLTVGGVIGRVTEVDDSELRLEIADGVVVRVARRSVATVLEPDEPDDDEEPEELEEPGEPTAAAEPSEDPR